MPDLTCPYCEEEFEIEYECFDVHCNTNKTECPTCEKTFVFSAEVSVDLYPEKADCLNGGGHEWHKQSGCPREYFIGRYVCRICGEKEGREEEKRKAALERMLR